MYLPPEQFTRQITPALPWTATLTWGDIVSFRFPVAEEEGVKPKARPCLVLDVEDRDGLRFATLAYGTSVGGTANRGFEIRVSRPEEAAAAGLDRPTRFVGARRITVSVAHPGFCMHRVLGTPVLGRLTGASVDRMNRVRARIHAERDIAVYFRTRTPAQMDHDRRITAQIVARLRQHAA